ncbi:MAG TPA: DNA starvation/stationary phase protection protein [Planctomycetota bacterium]|nr:DNA starvation/stationary phase protection protein [Planctomycetota bacterium]
MNPTQSRGAHAHATGLGGPEHESLGASLPLLRRLAASEIAFYVKVKAAHWTVFGPFFREIHFLLDDIAKVSIGAIDDVAERISQIGGVPPLGIADVSGLSVVKDRSAVKLSNREALEAILADMGALVAMYREATAVADENKDAATVDTLSKIVVGHEKYGWFLRETLVREGGNHQGTL